MVLPTLDRVGEVSDRVIDEVSDGISDEISDGASVRRGVVSALAWAACVPLLAVVGGAGLWLLAGSQDGRTTVPSWKWLGAIVSAVLLGVVAALLLARLRPSSTFGVRCLLALVVTPVVMVGAIGRFDGPIPLASTPPASWPGATVIERATSWQRYDGSSEFGQDRRQHSVVLEAEAGDSLDDLCDVILRTTDARPIGADDDAPCGWWYARRSDGDTVGIDPIGSSRRRLSVQIVAGPAQFG